MEKITSGRANENAAKFVKVGDGKEKGTCKYCDDCTALKDMKDHYLTHLDKEDTDTKIIKMEEDEKYNFLPQSKNVGIVWLGPNPSQKGQV